MMTFQEFTPNSDDMLNTKNEINVNKSNQSSEIAPKRHINHKERKPFSKQEDILLKQLIEEYGVDNWTEIAAHMKNRSVRQCRERWNNNLSQGISKEKWTKEEDALILQKYEEFGSRWKIIELYFNGRTSYSIRNRYNSLIRIPKKKGRKLGQKKSIKATSLNDQPLKPEPEQFRFFFDDSELDEIVFRNWSAKDFDEFNLFC